MATVNATSPSLPNARTQKQKCIIFLTKKVFRVPQQSLWLNYAAAVVLGTFRKWCFGSQKELKNKNCTSNGFDWLPKIPELQAGLKWSQVSSGTGHTVLLRSDGLAVHCGHGQYDCGVPELPTNVTYSQVSAGYRHTVLLRSDGCAVAFGDNDEGQCKIPELQHGVTYRLMKELKATSVLRLFLILYPL